MSAAQLLKILKVSFDVVRGPSQGEKFSFEKGSVTVGRGPENDVVVSQDVKVSRQHLEFLATGNQVVLRNLSQKNPVAVDGEIVNEKVLRPGAIVRLGETELKIGFDKPVEARPNLMAVPISAANPLQPNTPATNTNPGFPAAARPSAGHSPMAGTASAPGFPHAPPPPGIPLPAYSPPSQGNSRLRLYIIIGVVLGAAAYLSQSQIAKRKSLKLRDSVSTELAISDSQNEYEKSIKEIEKKGQDTTQYRLAQEQYLRGFRDYRQGQFARAMEEFQAALSFFPNHDMARKYYTLAKRKFDEEVQFNMIQGKRYYGISNYRLCMGYYSNVVKMKKDERDPIRREALQYYNECEIKLRGKF